MHALDAHTRDIKAKTSASFAGVDALAWSSDQAAYPSSGGQSGGGRLA